MHYDSKVIHLRLQVIHRNRHQTGLLAYASVSVVGIGVHIFFGWGRYVVIFYISFEVFNGMISLHLFR